MLILQRVKDSPQKDDLIIRANWTISIDVFAVFGWAYLDVVDLLYFMPTRIPQMAQMRPQLIVKMFKVSTFVVSLIPSPLD